MLLSVNSIERVEIVVGLIFCKKGVFQGRLRD